MRISDRSSDVCSSDLGERVGGKLEERFGAVDDAIGGVIDEAARLQALAVAHLGDRRSAAGLEVKMDKEVGALAGRQPYGAVGQLARRDRLAVQGDALYAGVLDAQPQDARVAGVAAAPAPVGVMPRSEKARGGKEGGRT